MAILNQRTKQELSLWRLASPGSLHKTFIVALLASTWIFCSPLAFAAGENTTMPLCASVKQQMRDPFVEMAVLTAFGPNAKYLSTAESDADNAPPCEAYAILERYEDGEVLITSHTDGGTSSYASSSYLSAYFLPYEGGALKLASVVRNFGAGEMSGGATGKITSVRFGLDAGLMVSGGYSNQGYTEKHSAFYVFQQNGGIASLGFIPLAWDNSGATGVDGKPGKVISIDSNFDPLKLQSDQVPVTYIRKSNGKTQIFKAIWQSVNGRFFLKYGYAPKEIMNDLNEE